MSASTKPLYGRINFGQDVDLPLLIERLEDISRRFLGGNPFSAYLLVAGGQSFYGLSCEELNTHYSSNQGKVSTLSASATSPEGKGMNIVIHFQKGQSTGPGRFMIAAGGLEENLEIRDLLLGIWQPRPAPVIIPEPEIAPEPEKEPDVSHPEPQPPEEQKAPEVPAFPSLEAAFHFDPETPINTLVDRLYDLFIQYLDDATFEVRVLTYETGRALEVQVDHLRNTLKRLSGQIRQLDIELRSPRGPRASLQFSYAPLSRRPESRLVLATDHNEEIKDFILTHLATVPADTKTGSRSSGEVFHFDPKTLTCNAITDLCATLVEDQFSSGNLFFSLLNRKGLVHTLEQAEDLCKVWGREKEAPSFLDINISRPNTGQTLHLSLDFEQSRGSLFQLTGGPATRGKLHHLIFESLGLQAWTGKRNKHANVHGPSLQLNYDVWAADPVPESGLVLLPHQDGLADEIWYELQKAMQEAGFSCYRADSLFGYLVADKLWTQLMRAEVVIADLSEQSPEVFYLLGVALTLGKRTLLLSREAGDLPFDFKKYPHILYQVSENGFQQLRRQLVDFLVPESNPPS